MIVICLQDVCKMNEKYSIYALGSRDVIIKKITC